MKSQAKGTLLVAAIADIGSQIAVATSPAITSVAGFASVPTSTDTGIIETKASAAGGGAEATAPGIDDNAAVNLHVRAGCRM